MELPKRKANRLENYDYSRNGAYFITLCVRNRKPILSRIIVGASIARPSITEMSSIGRIVDNAIQAIPDCYSGVIIDKYVIMPNHIHMIIRIDDDCGRAMLAPTNLSRIIQQMKGYVTKQIGKSVWQKSYYDHIIRDDHDFQVKWEYIDENPLRWRDDEFYTEVE